MEPPNGHPCPECGAPRQQDKSPSCVCAHRATEALRDTRTAQAAAAEDFDPLRIRPYVELDEGAGPAGPEDPPAQDTTAKTSQPPLTDPAGGPGPGASRATAAQPPPPSTPTVRPLAQAPHSGDPAQAPGGAPRQSLTDPVGAPRPVSRPGSVAPPPSPADTTMPLRPVEPDATTAPPVTPAPDATTALPSVPAPDQDATTVLPVVPAVSAPDATSVLPTPLVPDGTEPSVTDLRMFDRAGTAATMPSRPESADAEAEAGAGAGGRSRRRRRTALIAAAGACVAVVTAAGYASGLFFYEGPSRNTALPDDIRASVPDAPSSSAASSSPEESAPATPSTPAAPPPAPSRTSSPSASPSPSAPSPSASPSRTASPSAPETSASASSPGKTPPGNSRQNGDPTVLRLGDRGPEVTELQSRLRQLFLYDDDTDGTFDNRLQEAVRNYQYSRGVQSDDLGVYDRETRTRLESETREP
ncbi:peptidoglycan-binding protein [Streptomyces sp. NPDC050546]|uniref:peptidoglycan-binding protein n=1 Tax=Streptomyces sp. NPDC050546 TaxID=3365628 RepID=UPI0037ADA71F